MTDDEGKAIFVGNIKGGERLSRPFCTTISAEAASMIM